MSTTPEGDGATAGSPERPPRRWLLPLVAVIALALVAGMGVYAFRNQPRGVVGKGRLGPRDQIELLLQKAGSTRISALQTSPGMTIVWLADQRVLTYLDGDVTTRAGAFPGNGPVEPMDVAGVQWPDWSVLEEAGRRHGRAPSNQLNVAVFKRLRDASSAQWELQVGSGSDHRILGALPDLTPIDHDLTQPASLQAALHELGRLCGPTISALESSYGGYLLRCRSDRGTFELTREDLAHRQDIISSPGKLTVPSAAEMAQQVQRAREKTGIAAPLKDFGYREILEGSDTTLWSFEFEGQQRVYCRPSGCHT